MAAIGQGEQTASPFRRSCGSSFGAFRVLILCDTATSATDLCGEGWRVACCTVHVFNAGRRKMEDEEKWYNGLIQVCDTWRTGGYHDEDEGVMHSL
jgi:hypothetical protein